MATDLWTLPVERRDPHNNEDATRASSRGGRCLWALWAQQDSRFSSAPIWADGPVQVALRHRSLNQERALAYRSATSSQLMMWKKFLTYSARLF